MSSMMPGPGGPPPSISIGGPGPGGPPPGGPGPGGPPNGPGDPDAKNVTNLLRQAMQLVNRAAAAEGDDSDASKITKIAAMIHAQIAAEQDLTDSALGGGPGVKLVRKAAAGAGSQGGF